ncbi:glycoside hydrolase family 5 protein [Natronolimnobius sp. AArcel1]|uniref:glycoside hydrolase family 5 protein n=1 Tax=Natronolimnobius sp. AArcel1 TaxID=1679093 RepID=UPI0019CFA7DA|nr:cellulase family glycosylhydrolase [Natronolimnobius sp. AArcel1]
MERKCEHDESGRFEPTEMRSHQPTRRSFVKAAGVGVGGLALGGLAGTTTAADEPLPRLETDGKWIVTEDGEQVRLRGFATASLDFMDEDFFPKTQTEVVERGTDGEKWHPNVVRLPITEDAVHEQGMDYVVDDLLRPAVDLLAERGIYAMIDLHLIRPYIDAEAQAEEMVADGWADSLDDLGFNPWVETDDLLEEFWSAVSPAFADDTNVLYELYNEPTLPVTWSDYGEYGSDVTSEEDEWLLWRDEAQPWVDTIREHAPDTPIIVGSPDWTSRTAYAPEYPFEGENLIYASHIYPDNGVPEEFDHEYGAPAEEVPVVCTEFGWDPDEEFEETVEYGTTSEWGNPFREWIESYENMGWVAWCFDDSWAPTFFDSPGEGTGEPWELKDDDEQMGWYIREWLEEEADGDNGDDDETDNGGESITVGEYETTDTTSDGRHNDFTGDGQTSHDDVTAFFENLEDGEIQDNPEAFDFAENDELGFADVVELLRQV